MQYVEFCDLRFGSFSLANPALCEMEAVLHQSWLGESLAESRRDEAGNQRNRGELWQDWRERAVVISQKQKSPGHHAGALDGMRPGSACGSDVQQVVIGEFGLVRDEREARFGLGAHQPLHRIRRGVAVVG